MSQQTNCFGKEFKEKEECIACIVRNSCARKYNATHEKKRQI